MVNLILYWYMQANAKSGKNKMLVFQCQQRKNIEIFVIKFSDTSDKNIKKFWA